MVTMHIAAAIVGLLGAAFLGALAGSLGASSREGRVPTTWDHIGYGLRELEVARSQRDGTEKALERATTALSWLVDETPGLDAALEFPPDAADIIERVEALREDLVRRDAIESWRDFAGEREFEDVW